MMISFIARSAVIVIVGWGGGLFGLRETYFISAAAGLVSIPSFSSFPKKKAINDRQLKFYDNILLSGD
ncbi:MAG: hypothetical protein JRD49_09930 [Deltaproteobacteria bacterium]|nr:hypothetical protein [Deltaproteobacteria bacterium]